SAVLLPYLQLGFFLEDPHEDWRLGRHVLLADLGNERRRERRKRTGGGHDAVGVTAGKQQGSRHRCGRPERADRRTTFQPETPPLMDCPRTITAQSLAAQTDDRKAI